MPALPAPGRAGSAARREALDMTWLDRATGWTAAALMTVVGLAVVASMALGTADVVGTQLFNSPVPGATEAISSLLVIIVYGALPYVQRRRASIRMALVHANVGPRVQAAMDVAAHAVALAFFGLLLWQAVAEAAWSWSIKQTEVGLIRFPIYPFKAALAVGVALLMLQLVADLLADLRRLRRPEA